MKIVVLDGFAANPGDLSWDFLKEFTPDVTVYDRTPKEKILQRAEGADIVILNKTPLTKTELSALTDLKLIAVLATGYNVVDCAYAREKGIAVANVPAYSTNAVAQLTLSFILEFASRVGEHTLSVKQGGWASNPDFSYHAAPTVELEGKTVGIIGFGSIGRRVAALCSAFGMNVVVNTAHPEKYADYPFEFTDLSVLLSRSDFVTVHCPQTEKTTKMVNADFLSKMKRTAFLVNTSRGGEVDEYALADALNSGVIAGAGVDVLSAEPPAADNPLIGAKNIFITPHIAWAAYETRARLLDILYKNIRSFLDGTPVNIVN